MLTQPFRRRRELPGVLLYRTCRICLKQKPKLFFILYEITLLINLKNKKKVEHWGNGSALKKSTILLHKISFYLCNKNYLN